MPKASTLTRKFYVELENFPITGLTDGEGRRLLERPIVTYVRPRDYDGKIHPGIGWLAPHEIGAELTRRGLDEAPDTWPREQRPLTSGLRADLYKGVVIEADSEYEARAKFERKFGIRKTSATYTVREAKAGVRTGPANPIKPKPGEKADEV